MVAGACLRFGGITRRVEHGSGSRGDGWGSRGEGWGGATGLFWGRREEESESKSTAGCWPHQRRGEACWCRALPGISKFWRCGFGAGTLEFYDTKGLYYWFAIQIYEKWRRLFREKNEPSKSRLKFW